LSHLTGTFDPFGYYLQLQNADERDNGVKGCSTDLGRVLQVMPWPGYERAVQLQGIDRIVLE
jgi:hypothetical protein